MATVFNEVSWKYTHIAHLLFEGSNAFVLLRAFLFEVFDAFFPPCGALSHGQTSKVSTAVLKIFFFLGVRLCHYPMARARLALSSSFF